CDGRDSNCDGQIDNVDAAFGLRVPMVYVRQEGTLNDWTRWPTTDTADRAFEFLRYRPHGASFGDGSTSMVGVDHLEAPMDLQAANTSVSLFHRDLNTGIVTMPMAHGARVKGSFDEEDVEFQLGFEAEAFSAYYDYSDLLFVSWYDDWRSLDGSSGDHVPATMKKDEVKLQWEVRDLDLDGDAARESDSALLQFIWQNGGSLTPVRFDIEANLPGSIERWRLYRPYTALRYLDPGKPLEIKFEWALIEESVCMSERADDGCRAVPYVCGAEGVLICPNATEENCTGCRDRDGDGYLGYDLTLCPEGDDCNDDPDLDPMAHLIHPGATETCDGRDTNCDGYVDAIGPEAIIESCPDGQEICGPAECGHRMSCSCAGEVDGCYCREGLDEDEYTSGRLTEDRSQSSEVRYDLQTSAGSDEDQAVAACAAAPGSPSPLPSPLWLLILAGVGVGIGRSGRRRAK
ncbi:MAG: putative metal-binding motif-containing protein, partial [Bradymonadaceae bacterium]